MKKIKILCLAVFFGILSSQATMAQATDSSTSSAVVTSSSATTARVDETSGTQRYMWYGGAGLLILIMIGIGVVRSRKKTGGVTSDADEISNPASGVNPF